jgi:hypothetical protein
MSLKVSPLAKLSMSNAVLAAAGAAMSAGTSAAMAAVVLNAANSMPPTQYFILAPF